MISQIQGLKHFVANHLSDVVDWSKHVRPEMERYPKSGDGKPQQSGDHAFILITTPFNRYRMSIASSYLEPPSGAPLACKSLGTVTFDDMAESKHIVGPKSDQTWADISKHIHVRELTDALAAARRETAEASPEAAGPARVKLAELAERAKKWGIAARVPDGFTAPIEVRQEPVNAAAMVAAASSYQWGNQDEALGMAPVHSIGPPVAAFATPSIEEMVALGPAPIWKQQGLPVRDAPWLGAPIMFITNPGEQIGGMQEIVGWCVKVYSHDRISIFMTPDHSEPSYRDNLPRRGSPAGNGRVHQFNCWDFNPEALRQRQRMDEMFLSITRLIDRIDALELHTKGEARQPPEEPPKRRGRPPKMDETDKASEPSPSPIEKPEGSEAA